MQSVNYFVRNSTKTMVHLWSFWFSWISFGFLVLLLNCFWAIAADPVPLSTKREIEAAKPNLDQIDIWNLPIEHYPLLSKFRALKGIKLFSTEGTFATDDKLDAIASIAFTNLAYIDLNNCRLITDAGIRHLSKIRTLRHLQLEGTAITDVACDLMATEMRLEVVNVANCGNVTKRGLMALGKAKSVSFLSFSVAELAESNVLELIAAFDAVKWCQIIDTQQKLDSVQLKAKGKERGITVTIMEKGAIQWLEMRSKRGK